MAFQIKDFVSISASMVNWVRATTKLITDFSIGSVVRTMLEAVATELEELYQQMFIGLKEAIPVATYNSFEFGLNPAISASGLIRVTITSSAAAVPIVANSAFTLPNGAVYRSTVAINIAPGSTFADVPVAAVVPGSIGNILANQSFVLTPAPNNFVSAVNLAAFKNGVDIETEEARKLRFNAFIQSLARGTTASIEYALTNLVSIKDAGGNITERVKTCSVVEPWLTDNTQPISLVRCYIHNGIGSTSGALVTEALKIIIGYVDANGVKVPGWKAAGVKLEMYISTELIINIAGALTTLPGFDKPTLVTSANNAAYSYILGLANGATFQVADLITAIKALAGVSNFVPADVAPPAAPALGSAAGGTLAATTYYAAITYLTSAGETLPSATVSLLVPVNNVLTVASPSMIAGASGWNVYVGTTAGTLTKQNAAPIAIGTGFVEPATGLIAGSVPPAASTARLVDIPITKLQKLMPGTMGVA